MNYQDKVGSTTDPLDSEGDLGAVDPMIELGQAQGTDTETQSAQPSKSKDPQKSSRRRSLFLLLAIVVVLGAGGFWLYSKFIGSNYVSTDNAYVASQNAEITPLTSGQIMEVPVIETQMVTKGQVVLKLDDSDQKIAVAKAEADVASIKRLYQQTVATGSALAATTEAQSATVKQAKSKVEAAKGDLARAKLDYDRRLNLVSDGAVSGDEVSTAKNAYETAQAEVSSAEAALQKAIAMKKMSERNQDANEVLIHDTTIDTSPDVLKAEAILQQARLELERTVIRSPIDGIIAKQTVQVGQHVNKGSITMIVVPIADLYVNANFKETQLGKVKEGQSVTLTSALYGTDVTYHGRVVGFSGGTGAAFALIPAQNATGNWIKVVQRLPVRIALDSEELKHHPLRVGLSMDVEIDISENS